MTESTNESGDSRKVNDSDSSTESNNGQHEQTPIDSNIDNASANAEQTVPPYKREAIKTDKSALIKKAILALILHCAGYGCLWFV